MHAALLSRFSSSAWNPFSEVADLAVTAVRFSKSAIAGLIFGAGMVLGAVQFIEWIGLSGSGAGSGCEVT